MKNLLPEWLFDKISENYLYDCLTEIRIRLNKPIVVCYKGRYEIITNKNYYKTENIYADNELINYILTMATKRSFYAYNDQIKQGFITTDSGIRIGLGGSVVFDKNEILTIKNISSLNIRIAHKIKGCSDKIMDFIEANGVVKNTLIISSPGAGKTTLIRDVAENLSNRKRINNILMIDERFELAGSDGANNLIDGALIDLISGSPKFYALKIGLKSMSPSVVVLDEISDEVDFDELLEVSRCGVKIIATAHCENIMTLKKKQSLEKIINAKIFERIIVLSKRFGIGTIEGIFDENLQGVYFPI